MRITFVGLFATLLLVAACETTPDEAASTAGAGGATEATGEGGVAGTAATLGAGGATPESGAVTPQSGAGAPAVAMISPDASALTREPTEAGRAVGAGAARAAVAPGTQEDFVLNVGDTVYFGYDKSTLTVEAQRALERQATWLAQYPDATITVQGHADQRGTREYNLALGERRATSVSNFIIALGVDSSRITVISYGKERPAALGQNEAAWAQNRRGVVVVN